MNPTARSAASSYNLFGVQSGELVRKYSVLEESRYGRLSMGDINGDGRMDLAA